MSFDLATRTYPATPFNNNVGTFNFKATATDGDSSWIDGADPTFIVRSTAEGKLIRVIVRYKDLQGFDEEATSESVGMPLVDKGDLIFTISGTAVVGNTLTAIAIKLVQTTGTFARFGAATFSFNVPNQGTRTFLALNYGPGGFNANSDSNVKITGLGAALTSISIV